LPKRQASAAEPGQAAPVGGRLAGAQASGETPPAETVLSSDAVAWDE
ncbi:MAG: hypothetical protein HZA28_07420, partial [Candidatus Omnitrophica bacterium]|nr:hypothetical protein [Candidatus Omnitrophota bacterium]MBI5150580.1 hypothetical protein [Candidatus Omnitrophota bacterium]